MKTLALVIGMLLVSGSAKAADCMSWTEQTIVPVEDLAACHDFEVDTCTLDGKQVPMLHCYDMGDDTHDFIDFYSFVPIAADDQGKPVMLVAF